MVDQDNYQISDNIEIEITVTRMSGASMHFRVQESDTIHTLKSLIEHAGGPSSSQQKIFKQETALFDEASFKELGLSGSVELTLITSKRRYAGIAKSSNLGHVGSVGDLFAERSFSVEVWVRVYQFNTANQGDNAILGCLRFDTNKALHCQLRNGTPMIGFYFNDTSAKKKIDLNTWTHLTFTYDLEALTQSIYIDGVLSGSRSGCAPLVGNFPVVIGEWAVGGYLNGEIALLNIWDRAFSSEEMVQETMKAGPAEAACIPEGLLHSFTFLLEDSRPVRIDAVTGVQCILEGEVAEIEDFPV